MRSYIYARKIYDKLAKTISIKMRANSYLDARLSEEAP